MTMPKAAALSTTKEAGGTLGAMMQTSMVFITTTVHFQIKPLKVSSGIHGKDFSTLSRELR